MEDFDETIGGGEEWSEEKLAKVKDFIKQRSKEQPLKRKIRNYWLGYKYRWQDRRETFYDKLNIKNMKNTLLLVGLVILVLAVILGLQAFAWVFTTIIHYGLIAIFIAAILFVYFKYIRKSKKDKQPKQ